MPLLDARYRGQAYELTIPYTEDVPTAFHAAHDRLPGHALPGREIEQVNLRLQAVGAVDKPSPDARSICDNDGSGALIRRRGRYGALPARAVHARRALRRRGADLPVGQHGLRAGGVVGAGG
ncbi:MAG: hypothetical protein U0521_02975 [Anaerolineae bacterium]